MIALWWCLSLCVAFLMGWCARVLVEQMSARSRPLPTWLPAAFPLSTDEKRALVVDLTARRLRKAAR